MLTFTLASATIWAITLMGIGLIFVCALLILIILIQKPKGGGLSAAFGGGGGSAGAAFGTKTGDVLTWVTVGLFVAFLGLAMGLTWAIRPAADPTTPNVSSQTGATDPGVLTDEDMAGDDETADPGTDTIGDPLSQDPEAIIRDMENKAERVEPQAPQTPEVPTATEPATDTTETPTP